MVNLEKLTENNFTWVCTKDGKSYYDLIDALTTEEVKLLQESCRNYSILLEGLEKIEGKAQSEQYGVKSNQVLIDLNEIIIKLAISHKRLKGDGVNHA